MNPLLKLSTVFLSSFLVLSTSGVSGYFHQNEKEIKEHEHKVHHEHRVFREVRHSPFIVHNDTQLNRALSILEHESQNWFPHHRHHREEKHEDEREEKKHHLHQKKEKKEEEHHERDFFFGRIKIVKSGVYKLVRTYVFSDGFKLELEGVQGVEIKAAEHKRHFIFDDHAILRAREIEFIEGGSDKEGFFGGSILFVKRASGFFEKVSFSKNKAWTGGAIFADNARHLKFHDVVFKKNWAERNGGAVAIKEEKRKEKKEKKEKKEEKHGKKENHNKEEKHEHHKKHRITRVWFDKVWFVENWANHGGAIWNAGSRTKVEFSWFIKNHAHKGGAIFNAKHGRLLVIDSKFEENKAAAKGGAIFNSKGAKLWVICSVFKNNEAPLGADIFNNGWLHCTVEHLPIQIDGHGRGYCTWCHPPAIPGSTARHLPPHKIKKVEHEKHEEKKQHHNKEENDLLAGLFANKNKNEKKEEKEPSEHYFYDYYQNGDSTAYDRWNGYYGDWIEEEEHEHKKRHHHGKKHDDDYYSYDGYYGWEDEEREHKGKGHGFKRDW